MRQALATITYWQAIELAHDIAGLINRRPDISDIITTGFNMGTDAIALKFIITTHKPQSPICLSARGQADDSVSLRQLLIVFPDLQNYIANRLPADIALIIYVMSKHVAKKILTGEEADNWQLRQQIEEGDSFLYKDYYQKYRKNGWKNEPTLCPIKSNTLISYWR